MVATEFGRLFFDESDRPTIDGLWTTTQASKMTGATYRQIYYWMLKGHVQPEVPARGSGSTMLFTQAQVERIKELKDAAYIYNLPFGEFVQWLQQRS